MRDVLLGVTKKGPRMSRVSHRFWDTLKGVKEPWVGERSSVTFRRGSDPATTRSPSPRLRREFPASVFDAARAVGGW